jgi:hypothetical protein
MQFKVLYPYSLFIGSLEISADKIASGFTLAVSPGDFVTSHDGNSVCRSEKITFSGMVVDLTSAEKTFLTNNQSALLTIVLRLDSNNEYEYLSFDSILQQVKSVQAGSQIETRFKFETIVKNADDALNWGTFLP